MAAVGQSRSQEHAFCLYQCLPQFRRRALRHRLDDETSVAPRVRSPRSGWLSLGLHRTGTGLPTLALRQAELLAEGLLEPGGAAWIGTGQAPGCIGYVARARHWFPDHGQQIRDLLGRTLPTRRSLGRSGRDDMVDGEMHEGNSLGQYRVERGWPSLAQQGVRILSRRQYGDLDGQPRVLEALGAAQHGPLAGRVRIVGDNDSLSQPR